MHIKVNIALGLTKYFIISGEKPAKMFWRFNLLTSHIDTILDKLVSILYLQFTYYVRESFDGNEADHVIDCSYMSQNKNLEGYNKYRS